MRIEKVGGATRKSVSPTTRANSSIWDWVTETNSAPVKVRPTESGLSISEFRGEVLTTCNEDRTSSVQDGLGRYDGSS